MSEVGGGGGGFIIMSISGVFKCILEYAYYLKVYVPW